MKHLLKLILNVCLIAGVAPVYAGRVDSILVYSPSMHKDVPCLVILPDGYSEQGEGWPVLYLLHGYGGDFGSWLKLAPDLLSKVDAMDCIMVCPDGGFRSWYLDSPIDTTFRYESHIIRELIPFIDSRYKTIEQRSCRAITGLSMGGHGGLFLTCRHPDIFGAVGSTSGGVDIRQYTQSWDLKERILGDTICCKQNWEEYTVINLVERLSNGLVKIIIDCGTDDFFIGVNRDLHQKLLKLGIGHDYTERPGSHDADYWRNSIDYHLVFFDNFFDSSTYRSIKVDKQKVDD